DGANLYAYVRNDPLNYADPSGLVFETISGAFNSLIQSDFSASTVGLAQTMLRPYSDFYQRSIVATIYGSLGAIARSPLGDPGFYASIQGLGAPGALLGGIGYATASTVSAIASVIRAAEEEGILVSEGVQFFRGAKPGNAPNFIPRPGEFRVDPNTGFVRDTHGVSVFDNPGSVASKGFNPHEVDQNSIPGS